MGDSKRRKKSDPNYGKPWWQQQNQHIKLEAEPDYTHLVELYLSQGSAEVIAAIIEWLGQTGQVYNGETPSTLLSKVNQVSMTVYNLASKQVQNLASHDPKLAAFKLKIPCEPDDYAYYQPVVKHRKLATEAMRVINTGFFDGVITFLLNKEGDAVSTLRKCGVVVYMGTNDGFEMTDAACALVTWNPFEVSDYAGESRNSLSKLIEKTFSPLANEIQRFRIQKKGADKFPCLSLLFLVENKSNGSVCEFRKHYTAQSGNQLTIPGFSSMSGTVMLHSGMNVLGKPRKIPLIRGFDNTST